MESLCLERLTVVADRAHLPGEKEARLREQVFARYFTTQNKSDGGHM